MLYMISIGLHDERDMSLKALEAARACDSLYAEFYTTKMETSAEKISKLVGKEVKELKRKDIEDGLHKIIEEAKNKSIGIFVGGDALVATTHTSLLIETRKMGIRTRIIHGPSIYSAVGETGLQLYKFGKTTTLAFPQENYFPTGCYDVIAENKKRGLHTLVLLDVKVEEGKCMSAREGLEILMLIEKEKNKGLLGKDEKIVAVCMLGSEKQTIKYDTMQNLMSEKELNDKTPAVLIVPGELHFMEKEFLEDL